MIISVNTEPLKQDFENLLQNTLLKLEHAAKNKPHYIATLGGRNLEPYIYEIMTQEALSTPFEHSIELIGGQRFPDIIAKKYYGIEVKTTTQNHWKTTGNSVFENTRVNDVERIFMLFAKLADPIEFRCRPYEEVLSEVVVTHSPRYLIDMNLPSGHTIFDKINLSYDQLRKSNNPIDPIKSYYKTKLKEGEELWWMDNEKPNNIILRMWGNLTPSEKDLIKTKAMIFFPELFSNNNDKFGRLAMWLVQYESIVCHNVRDQFTAGGTKQISFDNIDYGDLPQIYSKLTEQLRHIHKLIASTPSNELTHYWNIPTSEISKYDDWRELVLKSCSHPNAHAYLTKLLYSKNSP